MKLLGLDIGQRRTGIAFADTETDVLFSLATIHHDSFSDLLNHVQTICQEKQIDEVVLGLPKLPSGETGAQAEVVEEFAALLDTAQLSYSYVDERYTSPNQPDIDKDAAAACAILAVKLG